MKPAPGNPRSVSPLQATPQRPDGRQRAEGHPSPAAGPAALRVVKKLAPHQRGAVALTRQHGDALVCVRHRQDAAGAFRYTTVELLVECKAIAARNDQATGVRIDFRDHALRTELLLHGGHWDSQRRLWIVSRRVATKLGLQGSLVAIEK